MQAFERFLLERDGALQRLSRLSRGRYTVSEKPALLWFLAAPEDSDPLVRLQEIGEQIDWIALARATYSEIAAYLVLFVRFNWDREKVAGCLHISALVLRCRLMAAGNRARHQPSLFDGVDYIDQDFIPLPSRARYPRDEIGSAPEQMVLLLCSATET